MKFTSKEVIRSTPQIPEQQRIRSCEFSNAHNLLFLRRNVAHFTDASRTVDFSRTVCGYYRINFVAFYEFRRIAYDTIRYGVCALYG